MALNIFHKSNLILWSNALNSSISSSLKISPMAVVEPPPSTTPTSRARQSHPPSRHAPSRQPPRDCKENKSRVKVKINNKSLSTININPLYVVHAIRTNQLKVFLVDIYDIYNVKRTYVKTPEYIHHIHSSPLTPFISRRIKLIYQLELKSVLVLQCITYKHITLIPNKWTSRCSIFIILKVGHLLEPDAGRFRVLQNQSRGNHDPG